MEAKVWFVMYHLQSIRSVDLGGWIGFNDVGGVNDLIRRIICTLTKIKKDTRKFILNAKYHTTSELEDVT